MTWIRRVTPKPVAWPPPHPRDADAVNQTLAYARARDPYGDAIHTAYAMAYLFTLPLGTSPKDIVWAGLGICALVRFPFIWRCYTTLLRNPLAWLMVAWTAWQALSMAWSPDRAAGFDELAAFRVLAGPLLLWPVLDRATWLIGALLVGVFGQNLV